MQIIISALHFAWDDIGRCLQRVKHEFSIDGIEFSWSDSFERPHCTKQDLKILESQKGEMEVVLNAHIWNDLAQLGLAQGRTALWGWLEICKTTGVKNLLMVFSVLNILFVRILSLFMPVYVKFNRDGTADRAGRDSPVTHFVSSSPTLRMSYRHSNGKWHTTLLLIRQGDVSR